MIARHDTHIEKADIWSRLAEPLPNGVVYWRQDGKAITRDGKQFARFVAYIEANTARERLDAVVPGEWDLTLELLPPLPGLDDGGDGVACSFKARLQILGVIREDVGTGRDYKSAATDAFKRAAVRFGIAHELYAYEQNWVQLDGDGRSAKPLEDPGWCTHAASVRQTARHCPTISARTRMGTATPDPLPPAASARIWLRQACEAERGREARRRSPRTRPPTRHRRATAFRLARNAADASGTTVSPNAIRRRRTTSAAIARAME